MKRLIYNYKEILNEYLFVNNWIEVPLFYNNKNKTLRFDIESKSEMESAELIKNIFNDVFFEFGSMIIIFYGSENLKWSKGKKYFKSFSLKRILKMHFVSREEDAADEKTYLVACLSKKQNFNLIRFLSDYLENKHECQMAFISLKKGTTIQLYDNRGFDVLSLDKDFLKRIYFKYEKDILEYNRREIITALGI